MKLFLFYMFIGWCMFFSVDVFGQSSHSSGEPIFSYQFLNESDINILRALDRQNTNNSEIALSNHLHIEIDNNVVYDKAELIEKGSGKMVLSQIVDGNKTAINMSEVKAGLYTLILTNKTGNIKVEDVLVLENQVKN